MPRLNYRAFEVTIVLSSYENRLINFYDAPVHYEWLLNRAVDRDLIRCGNDGLCFKKEIVLPNGVHCKSTNSNGGVDSFCLHDVRSQSSPKCI